MKVRVACRLLLLPLMVATACSSSSPTSPTSGSASVTVPQPVQPATGVRIPYASQPVTLMVTNAPVTGPNAPTYDFEVATDSGFANKVFTNASVAQGSNGQTSVQVGSLSGSSDYYWHVRVQAGGTTGAFGTTFKFTVGSSVTLSAPVLASPAPGASTAGWPALTVNDSARSGGTVASLSYRFDVASDVNFNNMILSATVAETPNQTSYTPSPLIPPDVTTVMYWRVTAVDQADAVSSPASTAQNFTFVPTYESVVAAQLGTPLWPGQQPPGTNGHIQVGDNWTKQALHSFDGTPFISPTLDALQVLDLIDKGFQPQAALDWMNSHGYPTVAVYYPAITVIGFPFEYMVFETGQWDLVKRSGA